MAGPQDMRGYAVLDDPSDFAWRSLKNAHSAADDS